MLPTTMYAGVEVDDGDEVVVLAGLAANDLFGRVDAELQSVAV